MSINYLICAPRYLAGTSHFLVAIFYLVWYNEKVNNKNIKAAIT